MSKKGKLDRLERELKAAHRRVPDLTLSEGWRGNLMRDIARLPRPQRRAGRADIAPDMGRLVHRFAGACAVVAILIGIYALIAGIDIDTEITRLALQTQFDFVSQQLIGPLSGGWPS